MKLLKRINDNRIVISLLLIVITGLLIELVIGLFFAAIGRVK